jgi:hypothetical protein
VITDAALSKKGALRTNATYAQLKTISKLLDMLIFLKELSQLFEVV